MEGCGNDATRSGLRLVSWALSIVADGAHRSRARTRRARAWPPYSGRSRDGLENDSLGCTTWRRPPLTDPARGGHESPRVGTEGWLRPGPNKRIRKKGRKMLLLKISA